MVQTLRTLSGGTLLFALVLAPLDYGSTRAVAFLALLGVVAAGGVCWSLSHVAARTVPSLPLAMIVGAALVCTVALAWRLWLTAPSLPAFTAKHFARVAARWPTGIVPADPVWRTAWAAAAVLALFALVDLARDPVWRRAFCVALIASGVAVALLGLAQNLTHARTIYWERAARTPGSFFGPFYHHTSAGGYLNTVWPVAAGLAFEAIYRGEKTARGVGAALAVAACLVLSAHAGHISRFPQVVAALTLVVGVVWIRPWALRGAARLPSRTTLAALAAACALPVCVAACAGRVGDIRARWSALTWPGLAGGDAPVAPAAPETWPRVMRADLVVPSDHRDYVQGDRGAAYATACRAIAERPWLGWGPGGWMAAAAAHTVDPFIRTFFQMLQFTHEDFLQTVVEWGLLGAAGWALLILGGGVRAVARLRILPARDFIGAGAVLALGALLTQSLIDFPLQIPAIQFNAIALAALAWTTPAFVNRELPFAA